MMRVRKMKGQRRKKTELGCPIYEDNSNTCKEGRMSESSLDQQTDDGN